MAILDPEAERERLSRRMQEVRAELLGMMDAHPDLTPPQPVQKLYEHTGLPEALVAVVRDALWLDEAVNAPSEAAEGKESQPRDRSN